MIRLPEYNSPSSGKKEIEFPLDWTYRAVVDASSLSAVAGLNATLKSFGFNETFAGGQASSGGKYQSWKATVRVPDMQVMNALGDALGKVPGVKFLL